MRRDMFKAIVFLETARAKRQWLICTIFLEKVIPAIPAVIRLADLALYHLIIGLLSAYTAHLPPCHTIPSAFTIK